MQRISIKARKWSGARGTLFPPVAPWLRLGRAVVFDDGLALPTQVLSYFGAYEPVWVEWLNDSSCNVLFADQFTAKRAIFGLGKPLPPEDVPAGQGAPLSTLLLSPQFKNKAPTAATARSICSQERSEG